ncbi:centrosomal protein 15 isoform X1 [Aquarana catesbeiana]|uniref:centrosomal protein 15 isoform X1 n=2 Tax=Aquarana catesbeiana TaxID=8400 RepID=UPI003CC9DE73
MTLYRDREEELERLHTIILDEKNKLTEEMKIHGEQIGKDSQASEAAHNRNQMLLKDFQTKVKNLRRRVKDPDPSLANLENQYWASVEEELPKWELFLLGKAQQPFGVKQSYNSKTKLRLSQTMEAPKKKSLPPSGFGSNTFPRVF